MERNSPYERGNADAYYWRNYQPHKNVQRPDGTWERVMLTDPAEITQYSRGYAECDDRKDYR